MDSSDINIQLARPTVNAMDTDGANNRRPEAEQPVEAMDTQESDVISDAQEMDNLSNNEDANMQYAPEPAEQALSMDTQPTVDTPAEDEVKSEATFDFIVENFSKLKESVLSDPCYVRNLPWKIMVMPRSDRNQPETRSLGFFLQCNGESESTSWSCNAVAELRLKSWKPGVDHFSRKIKHLFYSKENDWGFSYFISWNEIFDPEKCYVQDDKIRLEVYVSAEAPHGVFWDSKKHTGYVGLKNQGATCYMNSLLQTLYFTNNLRKSVYKIPTEADDSSKSVALALQRVFYDLQYTDKQVGTKKLTKSFGWETLDSFMQHDVQEFLRVLLDKLESKMKGTCIEGKVPELFEGKMTSYIKCKHIDYNSTRIETFYDIQLNIKGKKDIYESFQDYVTAETLEGDNKYDAGVHGFQDAEKGVTFRKFPPVLHLHLMRFQYDPITDSSVKFNDRFEFYEEIDLDRYCSSGGTPAKYRLHAVLVHSGDNHGGHYVVYINPPGDGKSWFKFDDDVVSSCTKQEAIDQNFGGVDDDMSLNAKHCSNAYMLVYIRESDKHTVLEEIKDDDIPSELVERLKEEKRMEQVRRRERAEQGQYTTVNIVLEEHFEGHSNVDLFDPEKLNYRTFKIKKTQTVSELVQLIHESFKVKRDQMRIWSLLVKPQQVIRPVYFDFMEEINRPIGSVTDNTQSPVWTIFLELPNPDPSTFNTPMPSFDTKHDILLFFKFYDPKQKRLDYLGHKQYSLQTKLSDVIPYINNQLGLPDDTELTVYEEHGPNLTPKTTTNETLEKLLKTNDDNHGSILIFEKKHQDEKLELATCEDYFRDLLYRFEILFNDKDNPNEPGFTIELSHRCTFEQMTRAVAQKINADPDKILFYKSVGYKDQPSNNALKLGNEVCLKEILTFKPRTLKKMYYQVITLSLNELEHKKQFKCLYITPNLKEEKELVLFPNKNGTVKNLLEEAATRIEFSEESTRRLRLVEIVSHKLLPILREDTPLENLQSANDVASQKIYRIEEIPREEEHLNDDEILIPVSHFSKEIYNSFGVPFFIKAKSGEPYSAVKQRIQKKLNVPDKEWEKYKFAFISTGRVENISDDSQPVDIQLFRPQNTQPSAPLPYLGLEHINKQQKRSRYTYLEKAIKIYN